MAAFAAVVLVLTLIPAGEDSPPPHVLVVAHGSPPGGDGRAWDRAYAHPQDAVDAAQAGMEVWVAIGTYGARAAGDPAVLVMKDGVSVYGAFAPGATHREDAGPEAYSTLSGRDFPNHIVIGASNATLRGFGIFDAGVDGADLDRAGGGMRNVGVSGLRVVDCWFHRNAAPSGGGMGNIESSVVIADCMFWLNAAGHWAGGGIYAKHSDIGITNTDFVLNKGPGGGAVYLHDLTKADIRRCTFNSNEAVNDGGAVCSLEASATITNCVFRSNSTRYTGGGVCTFDSSVEIVHCTFFGNAAERGGAVCNYNTSRASIVSTIMWDNAARESGPDVYDQEGSASVVSYSCIQTRIPGEGNTSLDPSWVLEDGHEFMPGPGSVCIDQGDPDVDVSQDITESRRPVGDGPDIGAYERQEDR